MAVSKTGKVLIIVFVMCSFKLLVIIQNHADIYFTQSKLLKSPFLIPEIGLDQTPLPTSKIRLDHAPLPTSQIRLDHALTSQIRLDHALTSQDYTLPQNLTQCPSTPPHLVGDFLFRHFTGNLSDIEKRFPAPQKAGGRYRPKECRAIEKVAIIIPYRDRWRNLMDFLNHAIPMFFRQQLDFTIFVVDQVGNETFNRALLMNIGFKESLKLDQYTCFIFHDVDLYPIHDYNLYRCEESPRHMSVAIQKFNFKLAFDANFGGATAYTKDMFEITNGFSNLYFGWGGEDGDQRNRLWSLGKKFTRYPVTYARYASPRHKPDKTNKPYPKRFELLRNAAKRLPFDGLNTLFYKVYNISYLKLYTHIKVTVDRQAMEKKTADLEQKENEEWKKRKEKQKAEK